MGAQAAERRRATPLAHSSVANRNRPYSWPQPALLLLPRLPSQLLLLPSLLPPPAVAAAPSSSGSSRRRLNDGSSRSDSRPGRGRDPSSVRCRRRCACHCCRNSCYFRRCCRHRCYLCCRHCGCFGLCCRRRCSCYRRRHRRWCVCSCLAAADRPSGLAPETTGARRHNRV